MSKRFILVYLLAVSLLSSLSLQMFSTQAEAIPNASEMTYATIESAYPETVDPAWVYDTASGQLIFNVYETLIFFDGERLDMYIPQLATEWNFENISGTTSPEGLPWYFRYVFRIRTSVYFHNTSYMLTPQDVEYSFERGMIQDRSGGPTWMLYEPLLHAWGADNLGDLTHTEDVIRVGKMIDQAVESNETHVWFNIAYPGMYAPFMQILANPWSSILSKQWINGYVIATLGREEWSGEWGDYSGWINYHQPDFSALDSPSPIMCGTGPFQLEEFNYTGGYWSIVRFEDYWRGWPADWPAPPYRSTAGHVKPAGYIDKCTVTWAYVWDERRDMFLVGEIDFVDVPRPYIDQVLDSPGVRVFRKLPTLALNAMLYTFNLNQTSPYLGVPGGLPQGTFNESGIPPDFFFDLHLRRALAYSLNYTRLIELNYGGEAFQPATWCPIGLPYWNPNQAGYGLDLARAEEEFRLAWTGQVWENGFKLIVTLPISGLGYYWNLYYLLKTNIESLNTRFHLEYVSLGWMDYFERASKHQLPLFTIGWSADYADPDDFVHPFMYSSDAFASWQGYINETIDNLIEEGRCTLNVTRRSQIYNELQRIYHEEAPSVPTAQSVAVHFERDWVRGWYYNPSYPGLYFYPLWKQEWTLGDIDFDGKVDMKDIARVALAFGSAYGPPMHPRWNFRCDINNDRKIDMKDIGRVAKNFGKTSPVWTP